MGVSQFQKFAPTTVKRSEIHEAPYNPRIITDEAKKKLRKNLKTKGLLAALVVNRRTMNLLSGHQRLSILDEAKKGADYLLTVVMVDLSPEEEKAQVVFFNNPDAQGEWDWKMVHDLAKLPDVDYREMGWELEDIAVLEENFAPVEEVPAAEEAISAFEELQARLVKPKTEEGAQKMRDNNKKTDENIQERDANNDCYLVVQFPTKGLLQEFLGTHGFGVNAEYVSADELLPRMRSLLK